MQKSIIKLCDAFAAGRSPCSGWWTSGFGCHSGRWVRFAVCGGRLVGLPWRLTIGTIDSPATAAGLVGVCRDLPSPASKVRTFAGGFSELCFPLCIHTICGKMKISRKVSMVESAYVISIRNFTLPMDFQNSTIEDVPKTREWDGNNFPDLASRARRGSPGTRRVAAVCLTACLRPQVRLGDLRSARWQGRETLPQRAGDGSGRGDDAPPIASLTLRVGMPGLLDPGILG